MRTFFPRLRSLIAFLLGIGCSWLYAAPSITHGPGVVTATGGTNATLSVVASGTGTITYQWRRAGIPIAGAIGASHTIVSVGPEDAGGYDVAVTDASGETTLSRPGWLIYRSPLGQVWGAGYRAVLGAGDPGQRETPRAITNGVTRVFAGFGQGFFLKEDGTLWATGTNYSGALGDGTVVSRALPVLVATDVAEVSTGHLHTLLLKNDHSLWAVGGNSAGQLGDGSWASSLMPVHVADGVAQVSAGFQHSAYLTQGGDLYVCGDGDGGRLGLGGTAAQPSPQLLATGVKAVSAGSFSTVFIRNDNSLWGTGEWATSTPTLIDTDVVAAVSEEWRVFYIKTGGTLWFRPGVGADRVSSVVDVGVSALSACGWGSAAAYLKTDGSAYAYGLDGGSPPIAGAGTLVGTGVARIASGTDFVYLLGSDGVLASRGQYGEGQLGDGQVSAQPYPVQLADDAVEGATGGAHTLTVTADGTLWSAGRNASGQLGDGTTEFRASRVAGVTGVARCAASSGHTLYIDSGSTLWAVGDNSSGQLGDGTTVNRTSPYALATDVVACAAGGSHTLYITRDATLWATGRDFEGQLGDPGTTDRRTTPFAVATDVVACAAGADHSLFVRTDGSLWAMGRNYQGQLGDGTTVDRPLPVRVAEGVVALSAGSLCSMFRTLDGTLYAMGSNAVGLFGDGTTTDRLLPEPIATDVVAFACGGAHALFLKADGSLWGAGGNLDGALGDGTTQQRATRRLLANDITAIAAGGSVSLFIQTPGSGTAPTVAVQPQPVFVARGGLGEFSVAVDGSAPIGYQWYKDGVAITGANGPRLIVPCAMPADAGVYHVVATNTAGVAISVDATLTLAAPATISVQPLSQNAVVGATATFSVAATGDGLSYQWLKDGEPIPGADQPVFSISVVQPEDAGAYSVRVDGLAGGELSATALLGVGGVAGSRYRLLDCFRPLVAGNTWLYTPSFSDPVRTHLRAQIVSLDGAITCYTGRSEPTPYESRGVSLLRGMGHFDGGVFQAEEKRTAFFQSDGVRCGLLGEYDATDDSTIACDGALLFPETMAVGESAVVTRDFYRNGIWLGTVSYGLRFVGVETVTTPAGTFADCLHVCYGKSVDPDEIEEAWWAPGVGTVRIRQSDATNPAVTFTLVSYDVQQPLLPTITAGPEDTTVALGDTATLAVVAGGTAPLAYQWYRGESGDTAVPLSGASFASCSIPALDSWERVWVRITNRSSYVDSRTALVVVNGGTMTLADWTALPGTPSGQRGALDTPAGDGVSNLMKFALGVPPLDDAGGHFPTAVVRAVTGQPQALGVLFAKNPGAQGIVWSLEVSPDLANWTVVSSVEETVAANPDGTVLVRLWEANPPTVPRRFARLRVDGIEAQ